MTKDHLVYRDDLLKKKAPKPRSAALGWLNSPIFKMMLSVFWCGALFLVSAGRLDELPRGWELVLGFGCFAAALVILWQTIRRLYHLRRMDEEDAHEATDRLRQRYLQKLQTPLTDGELIFPEEERADYRRSRSS